MSSLSVCLHARPQHANLLFYVPSLFYSLTARPVSAEGLWLAYVDVCVLTYTRPPNFNLIKACVKGADDHWDEKKYYAWTLSRNPELQEVCVENTHLDIWNKQLHLSFTMSRVGLNNSIFIEFPELYRQTAHFYGSLRGKSPSQGSVMGDKVSQWITQFHRAHSRRDANGMSLTEIERRLTSHAG